MGRESTFKTLWCVVIASVLGCYFETAVSSMNDSKTLPNAEGLEFVIQQQFALQVKRASLAVDCPSGLSGATGHRVMSSGRTSDGHLLQIEVEEKGDGAFGWLVVHSEPVAGRPS